MLRTVQPTDEQGSGSAVQQVFENDIQSKVPALSRFCKSLTRNHWDAEELLQETLLKAFVVYQLSGRVPTKSYLFKVAQNAHIDSMRKRRVTTFPLEDYDIEAPQNVDPMELRDAVQTLVRQLPLRQQWIFLLREVFQYTVADIAERTGITEGAVKAALYRARQKLQFMRNDVPVDTLVVQCDVQHEENTVAAYLAAIANDNPQLFLQLLARVQMQSDVQVGDLFRQDAEIRQRPFTRGAPTIPLHTTRSNSALAA